MNSVLAVSMNQACHLLLLSAISILQKNSTMRQHLASPEPFFSRSCWDRSKVVPRVLLRDCQNVHPHLDNHKLPSGKHCGYPKLLKKLDGDPRSRWTDSLPISFAFFHLKRTCKSWFLYTRSKNQSRIDLLSCSVSPLIYRTWPPTGNILFHPVTGLVRTTG